MLPCNVSNMSNFVAGFLLHGLPHGMCSVRWPDGSEFHGEFVHGEMTGYGRYIFCKRMDGRYDDAAEFRGERKGVDEGGGEGRGG